MQVTFCRQVTIVDRGQLMPKSKLDQHPTVLAVRGREQTRHSGETLDAGWLKQLALDCGADDVGLVEVERPELGDEREEILRQYPWTKTLLAFVRRMSREPVKSVARSASNLEFHSKGEDVNHIAGRLVERLEDEGVRAVNPSMGFPMEMGRYPGRIWVVSHKPVAVAAGLGHMGIHRNVIHPKFGNFILLGTLLLDREATEYDTAIDYNPCLECNLCVAACPVGAISPDGEKFNFTSCYTHNYREFMGGFNDWVEQIVDSKNPLDYRGRVNEAETSSMWQSLSFGPNYKAAYCLAVCPAGEDVIGPYLEDKAQHLKEVVKPLQQKEEVLYVVPGSDAEEHAKKRFGHKHRTHVASGINIRDIDSFLNGMNYTFQWNQSAGLAATYHFRFVGRQPREATVVIADKSIRVEEGFQGTADLVVTANSDTWLRFLAGEASLIWALLTRRIRLKGAPTLLVRFGRCFSIGACRSAAAEPVA